LKRQQNRRPLWAVALLAAASVALWQWATVHANFNGNWTALYCTGSKQPQPSLVQQEHVYTFPHSFGYDGQIYHYIAHDPFLRSDLKTYLDDPRLRYRRILIPLLAYTMAFGNSRWIDPAYEFLFLVSIACGVYWSCRVALAAGLDARWGLLFLIMPATLVSMDRLVVDGTLAALTAGFLCYSRTPSWKLFTILAAAALTRETGLLLVLACVASLAWRREFRRVAIFLLSAAPAVAWFLYVQTHATGGIYAMSPTPLFAILRAFVSPLQYPAGTPFVGVVHAADYLALCGALVAISAGLFYGGRLIDSPRFAAILLAVLAVLLQRIDLWQNVYGFGRIFTPLFLCLAYAAARDRKIWLLAPTLMILPRIAIQLAPQLLGVLHWIA
jgi:hypothetical protein